MIKEEHRRVGALILAHTGWWGALVGTALRVFNVIPQQYGVVIVLLIGVGVAAGLSLSRMRLATTIREVFKAGSEYRR